MTGGERASRIVDVARLAGVSAMTVSRVLNNKVGVTASTRERVLAAVGDLSYRTNRSARSLRLGQADRVVLVAHSLTWSPHSDLITALERAVRRNGSELEIVLNPEVDADDPAAARTVDPLLGAVIALDRDVVGDPALHAAPAAVVITAGSPVTDLVPTCSTRDDLATDLAVAHLIELGHRQIAHVAGPVDSVRSGVRQQAWSQLLAASGLAPGPVARGDWGSESGELAVAALMSRHDRPTAIFVADDLMAVGVLKHLHRMGLRVPDDVAVVGFGDMPGARSLIPGLTTVRQDFESVADEVVHTLFGHDPSFDRTDRPRLVVRESTSGRTCRAEHLIGA